MKKTSKAVFKNNKCPLGLFTVRCLSNRRTLFFSHFTWLLEVFSLPHLMIPSIPILQETVIFSLSMRLHRVGHDWSDLAAAAHASKVMLKILQANLQGYMNWELSDILAGFREGRGTRDQQCWHALDHQKSKRVPEKYLLLLFGYAKAFDCVDHNNLWKILKEMGIPDHLTCLLKICMHVKKQKLELDMEQQTGSKLEKEYIKAVYVTAYLTYTQRT